MHVSAFTILSLFVVVEFLLCTIHAENGGGLAPVIIPARPKPYFSWDTLPTAFHGANRSGVFTDDAVRLLATHQMVTIEKWYTPCASQHPQQGPPSCAVEDRIANVLGRIKAVNSLLPMTDMDSTDSNTSSSSTTTTTIATTTNRPIITTPTKPTTILYLNSMFDFQFYNLHGLMLDAESRGQPSFLRDMNGHLVSLCNDGDFYCNITTFDWTQAHVRGLWMETIANATRTGFVDGIFADHSAQEGVQIGGKANHQNNNQLCNGVRGKGRLCYNFTKSFAESFNSWHTWMTNKSQDVLAKSTGGPVIDGAYARYNIPCTYTDIRKAQETLSVVEVNKGFSCVPDQNCQAAFLTAAEPGAYLTCFHDAPVDYPERSYPLGAPTGPAMPVSGAPNVVRRTFRSGVVAMYDIVKNIGNVSWPGHPPPPPPPPAPTPPPAICGKLLANTGIGWYEIEAKYAPSVEACCNMCLTHSNCTQWAWHVEQPGMLCHLHSKLANLTHKPGCYSGILNQTRNPKPSRQQKKGSSYLATN